MKIDDCQRKKLHRIFRFLHFKVVIFAAMIKVDNVLVSDDLKETFFVCNLAACHGDCCVEGDAGAPLEEEDFHTRRLH